MASTLTVLEGRLFDLSEDLNEVRALLDAALREERAESHHNLPAVAVAAPESPRLSSGQRVLFPHKGRTCRGVVVDVTPKGLIIASDELGPTCNRARVEQHNVRAEV